MPSTTAALLALTPWRSVCMCAAAVAIGLFACQSSRGGDPAEGIASDRAQDLPAFASKIEVMVDGERVSLAESIDSARRDPIAVEYRRLRQLHGGTLAGQKQLALWCADKRLRAEERLHWRIVLSNDPTNQPAIKGLGLIRRRGQLFTTEQLDELKQHEQQTKAARKEWAPVLSRLRRAVEKNDPAGRSAAMQELESAAGAAAAQLIAEQLAGEEEELGMIAVALLSGFAADAAAPALVHLVTRSPHHSVRAAATERLRYYPVESYAPMLLAALAAPIELHARTGMKQGELVQRAFRQYVPTGRLAPAFYNKKRLDSQYNANDVAAWGAEYDVRSGTAVVGRRPDTLYYEYVLTRESPDPDRPYEFTGAFAAQAEGQQPKNLQRKIDSLQRDIQQANNRTDEVNQRVDAALRTVVDLPEKDAPSVLRPPTDGDAPRRVDVRFWWDWWRANYEPSRHVEQGVEVWTQLGLVPIERVLVGDRVLAWDPESGEHSLRLVGGVDKQPDCKLQPIHIGPHKLAATPQQRVWSSEQGWLTIAELASGVQVDTLSGEAMADLVAEPRRGVGYSLQVEDALCYRAGQDGLLIHDAD